MRNLMLALTALLTFWLAAPSDAYAEDPGVKVTVRVVDGEGNPIPTAVVRHPAEESRHRVNTENGEWSASVLYLPDGSELIFDKGIVLDLEISAPGYNNVAVQYVVKKRKNVVEVALTPFEVVDDENEDDVIVGFGRDRPIER